MSVRRSSTSERFNWEQTRQRLADVLRHLETSEEPSPEQTQRILHQRARQLAQAPVAQQTPEQLIEVITFAIANEQFALSTEFVREVVPRMRCTPIPAAPAHLVGVTNLRGGILAVFDLRPLGGWPIGDRSSERLLILGTERPEFGICVEEVYEVTRWPTSAILELPTTPWSLDRKLLLGVTADMRILLNGEALLQDERFFVQQQDADSSPR